MTDIGWGGLPFMYPSNEAMKYLHHTKVIAEEDIPVGAHYRARTDMLDNVRGYCMVKDELKSVIIDIERERRRALSIGCDRQTLAKGPLAPLEDRPPKTQRQKDRYFVACTGEFPRPVQRGSVDSFIRT